MKVLLLGDRFITNDIFRLALERRFDGSGIRFEYSAHQLQWPVAPMESNDEVAEFSGTDDEIIPFLKDAEVVLTHTGCFTKKAIDSAPALKAIALGRGGPVNVNVAACSERDIPVIYAPGRNSNAVAEFTVGMIIAQSRSIPQSHHCLRHEHRWRGDLYANEMVGTELSLSTVGLVGFGAIGSKVAKIMSCGFGSRILVFDPYISDEERGKYADYTFTDLDTLMSESDYVSLHAKATKETASMIGAREIGLMKRHAILVNTARPQLVDYAALYAALKEGRLRGAALDVFEDEPPSQLSMLYSLENVTATSHLGGASLQAAEIGAARAADGLYAFIAGRMPEFVYNKDLKIFTKG
ncbi:MAG: 2-hydroxyacid dehydrogenase [Synergistaceae bacterium]|jgi:D-3-phosphoglycerate dehydrogenase|nr:2-hydroxyacid dehydrogenase [Synergistaceae bacterium]